MNTELDRLLDLMDQLREDSATTEASIASLRRILNEFSSYGWVLMIQGGQSKLFSVRKPHLIAVVNNRQLWDVDGQLLDMPKTMIINAQELV